MMKVIVNQRVYVAGEWYDPGPRPQDIARDDVAEHLILIGAADRYETKIVEPTEKKSLSSSPVGQASPPPTAPRPRGRPPKSLS